MASGHTEQYQLNQWEANDLVMRIDFNTDNLKIEAALAQIAEDKASLETVFAVAGEVGKLRARIEALEKQISG
ncbi:hypothetical protein AAAT68_16305 [Lawsonibacter asaccharolyticus]